MQSCMTSAPALPRLRRRSILTVTSRSQALARSLRAAGSEGLVFPSQRDPRGQCAGLFYPDRAHNPVQGRHLEYHWDGTRVDLYRDASTGDVFRVG